MPDLTPSEADCTAFTYRSRKDGSAVIFHHGRTAATLRGQDAEAFIREATDTASPDAQHLMARLTGNYKRGNERLASQHPRNRR
jgi:hypothetical protein